MMYKKLTIISELRSFKNELNVSPGSYTEISTKLLDKNTLDFINANEVILKKLGRINKFHKDNLDKPSAAMVISGEIFKVYFDGDVDLKLIKTNLINRQEKYQKELDGISKRLSNRGFIDRAPKDIVDQEKTNYNNLEKDIKKISLTIESL